MKKFPVISESGNEYLVKLVESYIFENYFAVYVYETYVGLFGRKRFRYVNEQLMGYPRSYDVSKFDFNLVAVAKHEIKRMEDEWEADKLSAQLRNDAKRKFEEWDGDCR